MKQSISPFGKALRELRLDNDKSLVFIAKVLGCSIAHASAIERGVKSPPPEAGIESILKSFNRVDLIPAWRTLAAQSRRHVEINLENQTVDVTSVLVSLARTCNEDGLDAETAQKIKELLDKRKTQK